MPKATTDSTAADDAALRALLPSVLANRVLAYEDELQALRGATPRSAQKALATKCKMDAKAAAARATRSARLEALVSAAIHAKRARLELERRHKWTAILMRHFELQGVHIDEETVRAIVKKFPGF